MLLRHCHEHQLCVEIPSYDEMLVVNDPWYCVFQDSSLTTLALAEGQERGGLGGRAEAPRITGRYQRSGCQGRVLSKIAPTCH